MQNLASFTSPERIRGYKGSLSAGQASAGRAVLWRRAPSSRAMIELESGGSLVKEPSNIEQASSTEPTPTRLKSSNHARRRPEAESARSNSERSSAGVHSTGKQWLLALAIDKAAARRSDSMLTGCERAKHIVLETAGCDLNAARNPTQIRVRARTWVRQLATPSLGQTCFGGFPVYSHFTRPLS